jgi:hypothetical protein
MQFKEILVSYSQTMYIPKAQTLPAITGSPKEEGPDSSSVPFLLSLSL